MNKFIKVFGALMCVFLCTNTNAQSVHEYLQTNRSQKETKAAHERIVNYLLSRNNRAFSSNKRKAAKTTEVAERLRAQSNYYYTGSIVTTLSPYVAIDSDFYGYSGARSSYFNYSTMEYYNAYPINGANIFGFNSAIGMLNHNDEPTTLSDTTMVWQLNSSTFTMDYYDTRYATYDTNDNIINYVDYYADSALHTNNRYVNSFDSYNNISTSLALNQDSSSWDTSEFRVFSYDISNKLVEDSTSKYISGTWSPKEKYVYTYDTAGNIIQADFWVYSDTTFSWSETYQYSMVYNDDNSIQKFTESQYIFSWNPVISDSFGYTTGISYATTWQVINYNPASSVINTITTDTKHITIGGLPDTLYSVTTNSGGTIISKIFYSYSYDSQDEPILALGYSLIDTSGGGIFDSIPHQISHYYYGLYERLASHHNGINNTSTPSENITIYPNPATNQLSIYGPGISNGARITIQLINASGQLVRSESLPWYSETEKISVSGLTPGIYWLTLQDKAGNSLFKQTVVIK